MTQTVIINIYIQANYNGINYNLYNTQCAKKHFLLFYCTELSTDNITEGNYSPYLQGKGQS